MADEEFGPTVRPGCEVSESVWNDFVDHVERRKGYTRGQLGPQLENAIKEYLNAGRGGDTHDRLTRLEDMVSEIREEVLHTHTGHESGELPKNMPVPQKAKAVIDGLREDHDESVATEDLESAIKERVGGDPRTIRTQKNEIKNQRLAFEHPVGNNWYFDESEFFTTIQNVQFPTDDDRERIKDHDRLTWERWVEEKGYLHVTIEDMLGEYGYSLKEWEELREAAQPSSGPDTNTADAEAEAEMAELERAEPVAVSGG